MIISFWHSSKQLRTVQDLVKSNNGYFDCNPLYTDSKKARFNISFDSTKNCNKFSAMLEIIKQPYY